MNERRSFQNFLTIPVLLLCLGGLVIMPFNSSLPFEMETPGIEVEENDSFENSDLEDDGYIPASNAALAKLALSNSGRANLKFRSASFSPLLPPPRSA